MKKKKNNGEEENLNTDPLPSISPKKLFEKSPLLKIGSDPYKNEHPNECGTWIE